MNIYDALRQLKAPPAEMTVGDFHATLEKFDRSNGLATFTLRHPRYRNDSTATITLQWLPRTDGGHPIDRRPGSRSEEPDPFWDDFRAFQSAVYAEMSKGLLSADLP